VLVAGHAAAGHILHQAKLLEPIQRLRGLGLGHVHHRLAAGLLVAAGHHQIERERIGVGHGAGFFHQRAQHAGFDGG